MAKKSHTLKVAAGGDVRERQVAENERVTLRDRNTLLTWKVAELARFALQPDGGAVEVLRVDRWGNHQGSYELISPGAKVELSGGNNGDTETYPTAACAVLELSLIPPKPKAELPPLPRVYKITRRSGEVEETPELTSPQLVGRYFPDDHGFEVGWAEGRLRDWTLDDPDGDPIVSIERVTP
jgi:hypothetical protein